MDKNQAEMETVSQNKIRFEEGILGFEDIKDYCLYHEDDSKTIWNLQAAESTIPSFIVLDPYTVISDYHPDLSQAELDYFGEHDTSNLCFLVIAVIKSEITDSVVNLKAPLVINANTKIGKQIILERTEYPIRYKLFAN